MALKVTLLGTGTSGGVPSLGCECRVCKSKDPHDTRFRCAALIESESTRLLVDCGPDIRQQLLKCEFGKLDGVLLTHNHYDHLGGIDDLKPYCMFGKINIYSDFNTQNTIKRVMPYCFEDHLYPGVPLLELHEVMPHQLVRIGDIDVMPIQIMHGSLPILGFRFRDFAYITDMKTISNSELIYLSGVKKLVVNALRFTNPHHSHQLVSDAISFSRKVGALKTYLIHVNHRIGLHSEVSKMLPDGISLAYDGMIISC